MHTRITLGKIILNELSHSLNVFPIEDTKNYFYYYLLYPQNIN